MEFLSHLAPVAVALIVAYLATPPVMRLARRLGIMDRPSPRAVNRRPDIPLLGGLAVAAGCAAGLGVAVWLLRPFQLHALWGLILGGGLMLATGFLDDRKNLGALAKFAPQVVAAAFAIVFGFRVDHLSDPVFSSIVLLPTPIMWIATTLWIVGITNAVNLIDGLDGLATGVAAIIGATLTFIAWQAGQPLGVCMGLALVGALLGFLPFNFSPARIFLGDTGSLFIGFTLALLALVGYKQVALLTFVVPLLALAVPIMDTALSIVRRLRLGQPIFAADRLHMHHRLLASEGSARSAVLHFYFLTGAFSLLAVSFTKLTGYTAALFLVAVVLLTLRLLWNLGVFSLHLPEREEEQQQ